MLTAWLPPLILLFAYFRNILLTGGNCNFPGFKDRVYKDVRSMSPDEFEVNVTLAKKYVIICILGICMYNVHKNLPTQFPHSPTCEYVFPIHDIQVTEMCWMN